MAAKMLPIMLSLPLLALAQSVQVMEVGKGGYKFSPESVTAAVGSQVQFTFVSSGHSVSASTFDSPCKPVNASTFFSGDGDVGKSFTITVNSTDPIWVYCPESNHCESGMVGVINPPTSGQTLAELKTAAAKVGSSEEPPAVQGGVAGDGSSTSASASASASASGTKTATSASASHNAGGRLSMAFGTVGVLSALVAGVIAA